MYQRSRPRRFRRRPNGRNRHLGGSENQTRLRFNSFSNNHGTSHFNSTQSAEKLFEKYNVLAKEALSSGDKTLSENYLQHADHFMRIIEDKNRNQIQNKAQINNKTVEEDKSLSTKNNTNQELNIKEKKE